MNQLLNVIDIIDWQKHGFEQDLTSLNASTIFSFQSAIKKDYIKNIHTNQFLPLTVLAYRLQFPVIAVGGLAGCNHGLAGMFA